MDPFLYRNLAVDLTFFTVLVLFAAFALLMLARKNTNTRRPVSVYDQYGTNVTLAEIARVAQSRIKTLPQAPHFHFNPSENDTYAAAALPTGPVIVSSSKYMWESRWSHLPTFEQEREGEERVVNSLVNNLGGGWFIFRNFVLPTENEDIDVVLVGPGGIYAIEVENYSGSAHFERSRCYVKTPQGKFYRQKRSSEGSVQHSARHLGGFLREHNIQGNPSVNKLVVIGDSVSGGVATVSSTNSNICTLDGLRTRLQAISDSTLMQPGQVGKIVDVLKAEASEQMRHASSRVH